MDKCHRHKNITVINVLDQRDQMDHKLPQDLLVYLVIQVELDQLGQLDRQELKDRQDFKDQQVWEEQLDQPARRALKVKQAPLAQQASLAHWLHRSNGLTRYSRISMPNWT